jgi:hypothetical protein
MQILLKTFKLIQCENKILEIINVYYSKLYLLYFTLSNFKINIFLVKLMFAL